LASNNNAKPNPESQSKKDARKTEVPQEKNNFFTTLDWQDTSNNTEKSLPLNDKEKATMSNKGTIRIL